MDTPSLRWNALKLGINLLLLATNPWSGLTRRASRTIPWQPADPYGMPRWWPFAPGSGPKLVDLAHLRLMRSALRLPDVRSSVARSSELPERLVPGCDALVENKQCQS
jgi:hypothetical protein